MQSCAVRLPSWRCSPTTSRSRGVLLLLLLLLQHLIGDTRTVLDPPRPANSRDLQIPVKVRTILGSVTLEMLMISSGGYSLSAG